MKPTQKEKSSGTHVLLDLFCPGVRFRETHIPTPLEIDVVPILFPPSTGVKWRIRKTREGRGEKKGKQFMEVDEI